MDQISSFFHTLEDNYLVQVALTVAVVAFLLFTRWVIRRSLRRLGRKFSYLPTRVAAIQRLSISALYIFSGILITIIWGGDLENIWISIGSILGVVAIGFFAIWSILSNIVAGLIIYTINPFKITDTVILVEKDVRGKVRDIGLIYTTLEDEDGIISIPNNMFFQQVIKVQKQLANASGTE